MVWTSVWVLFKAYPIKLISYKWILGKEFILKVKQKAVVERHQVAVTPKDQEVRFVLVVERDARVAISRSRPAMSDQIGI